MVLLISYDLKKPGKDYKGLYKEIKAAGTWWHHLESVWMIQTSDSPTEWYERLRHHLDKGDNLLVIRVTGSYQGWLSQKAWDWLNARAF